MNILFQVPTPEFGFSVQGLDLVLGHFRVLGYFGFLFVNATLFLAGAHVPAFGTKCEHGLNIPHTLLSGHYLNEPSLLRQVGVEFFELYNA